MLNFPNALLAASSLMALPVVAANLINNGDFAEGLAGWSTDHPWYAQPKEAGVSPISLDPAGHRGACLRIDGQGKRGIAIQNPTAYPGAYRVSAWIRSEALNARGGILVEWFDRDGKYLRGDWAIEATGTTPWQRQERVLTAPAGTRRVHFDLVTEQPNQGVLWLDEIAMERVPSGGPAPRPALLSSGPAGGEGELRVRWDPASLTADSVRLALYTSARALTSPTDRLPSLVADVLDGEAVLAGLQPGSTWQVAAVTLDADGRLSELGPALQVTAGAASPPRAGWPTAERLADGRLRLGWSPHLLDTELAAVRLVIPARDGQPEKLLAEVPLTAAAQEPRPLFCTQPWVSVEVAAPADLTEVGARAVSARGVVGELATAAIWAQPAEQRGPWRLGTAGPTLQLPRQAEPPSGSSRLEIVARRGEAEGRQLFLRPAAPLHQVRVSASELVSDSGQRLDRRWLAWHFVNYVHLERNSRATPADELLWPAPADYPDELSDDLARDLPADQTQPIYLRVTVPPTATAGRYRGTVTVQSAEGSEVLPLELTVSRAPAPGPERFAFVYWYSWDEACKQFGVARNSAAGWRVLEHLGAMMKVYHQNSVVIPWHLISAWQRPDGSLQIDWSHFDRYLEVMRRAGVDRLFCLAHVGSRTTQDWLCPTMAAHRLEMRRLDTLETVHVSTLDLLPAVEQHVVELGLLDRFAVHVADEPIAENLESYRQLSAEVRRRAPRLRRIDAIHVPQLDGSLEIWVPQTNYLEKWLTGFQAAQKAGNELWFYVAWVPQGAHTNRMIDSTAIKPRLLHWLNALYGTTGYLHWALNHWHIPLTSLESPGDQYICWPSRRFVANSSLRYEAERDGMEEAELLAELGRAGTPAEQSHGVVTDFTHYRRSWEELEQARRQLLAELEQRQR